MKATVFDSPGHKAMMVPFSGSTRPSNVRVFCGLELTSNLLPDLPSATISGGAELAGGWGDVGVEVEGETDGCGGAEVEGETWPFCKRGEVEPLDGGESESVTVGACEEGLAPLTGVGGADGEAVGSVRAGATGLASSRGCWGCAGAVGDGGRDVVGCGGVTSCAGTMTGGCAGMTGAGAIIGAAGAITGGALDAGAAVVPDSSSNNESNGLDPGAVPSGE